VTAVMEVRNVHRVFRMGDEELHALDDVSLSFGKGELCAVMGTSGSGKSTLMNILGCLDAPTSGTYLLDGKDVTHVSRTTSADLRNRFIGFIFQNFQLLPRTTSVEQVELPLIYAGLSRKARRTRAVDALTRVGLGNRLDHHPNQLSGGQQQRVAIARALVTQPQVILADEPTGNLDSRTSQDITALLQELHTQGMTVLLVTHDPEMKRYVNRVISMKDGKVESDVTQQAEPIRRAEAA